jgi:mannosyltransferase OCH1-like enzyme
MTTINIPKIINRKEEIKIPTKIPKTIIQTYKNNSIDIFIYKNIMKMLEKNKEYEYRFITDEDAIEIIKNNFDNEVLEAFNKIKVGAAKGDFIRYIYLYLYGGIYLDLDASIEIDLNVLLLGDELDRIDLINEEYKKEFLDYKGNFINKEFIFFYNTFYDIKIEQWLIMVSAKNEIINRVIKEMINRINKGETNIFIATGPILFTDVIYNLLNGTNYYNINSFLIPYERGLFLESLKENKNKIIKNGVFYNRNLMNSSFKFTMEGYDVSILYKDEKKYKSCSNIFKLLD